MARSRNQPPEPTGDDELVKEVMSGFEEDKTSHDSFLRKVDDRYKAYHFILERRSKASNWTSKQHPGYAFQIIEVMTANLIDPKPAWRVKPRPRLADPDELKRLADGAKANEILLAQQADVDHLGEKETVFVKQALITGLSVYKTFWKYGERTVKRQVSEPNEILPGLSVPRLTSKQTIQIVSDDPTAEVVDVRDFIWHEAAISVDKAMRLTHRVLYSMDELHQLQAAGVYRNVDQLVESRVTDPGVFQREKDLFNVDRSKDQVEVLEQWRKTPKGMQVTTVGNGNVLLRDEPNPFWHGEFPFIICSSIPDLFRIPGVSDVELIADMQEILWTLINQRLDNTALLNNAIVLIAEDSEDVDQFEWAPGAQWLVPRPVEQNVKILQTTPLPAEMTFGAEDRIKQDIQDIPGASPSLLSSPQGTNTATEVSLQTAMGQKRVQAKKQQFVYCHGRLGEQWLKLNQQFIRDKRLVAVVGAAGAQAFHEVEPLVIQGDYYIDLEAIDSSLIKQERTAEAQARLQVAIQAAAVFAPLSQSGHTPMLNMKAFMDDFLDAGGISDYDRYYLAAPAPAVPGQGQGQPQQPQAPQNGSAPQSTDVNSPSNQFSQSPVAAMQRQLAMSGGVVNTPGG